MDFPHSNQRGPALCALFALIICGYAAFTKPATHHRRVDRHEAHLHVDLAHSHPVSPHLFGAFFEEINHAGEGGLYAEMVADRSFDGLAHGAGFMPTPTPPSPAIQGGVEAPGQQSERAEDDAIFQAGNGNRRYWGGQRMAYGQQDMTDEAWHVVPDVALEGAEAEGPDWGFRSRRVRNMSGLLGGERPLHKPLSKPKSPWQKVGAKTTLALTDSAPLGKGNPVALVITSKACRDCTAGVVNGGYWGLGLAEKGAYYVSLYLRSHGNTSVTEVSVSLQSGDGDHTYARLMFDSVTSNWTKFEGEFPKEYIRGDPGARVAVLFTGPGAIAVDIISVMPAANVARGGLLGNPWPFRYDLLQMLKGLRPRFLRFPGGCYVEGDVLKDAFRWKDSIGPTAERPGHWNLWGYWSTDGLGLFEYMQLAEEVGAVPVWVINNGVSHQESVKPKHLRPWLQDALDSVEFVTGAPDTTWGAVRAKMGRTQPWDLPYLAIGNEDCGKPQYLRNYRTFYHALRRRYPDLRLISNCDLGPQAPQDLYDWHMYSDPTRMFDMRTAFDTSPRHQAPNIFVSEFAVTSGGGRGNLVGAIAEAAFMTGLERNSDVVAMAAYAPLFVNDQRGFRVWPTNLIVFDSTRVFGIVSYHVQRLFSEHQGAMVAAAKLRDDAPASQLAASATCSSADCTSVTLKVVNMAQAQRTVNVTVGGLPPGAEVLDAGTAIVLTGDDPLDENSFADPLHVAPVTSSMDGLGSSFQLQAPPLSLTVLTLTVQGSASRSYVRQSLHNIE